MPKSRSHPNERSATAADGHAADPTTASGPFSIVGVGASAGGLEAVSELLAHLPIDTGMGVVLVQHLDPLHESALTQLLGRATSMPVLEVTDDLRVQGNHVYVIPPNTRLSITAGVLKLKPREASRTPLRSIDMFFESLAQDQGARAIGVILSGTASDGTLGLEAIKAEGGITFAQDDSAKYHSMPRSAASAGCVDFVLAPAKIAQELARIANHPYAATAAGVATGQHDAAPLRRTRANSGAGAKCARAEAEGSTGDDAYQRILTLLRSHSGVDFSHYKSNTIQRRINRRLLLSRQDTRASYAQFLKGNASELDALFSDVLINVTGFFRNPEAFEVLEREVLPTLLAQRGDGPLRVWVPACSTGQEAYSIAMSFVEAADKAPHARSLQIFATDLNDALLDKARYGLYTKAQVADVSLERLGRFFVEEGGGWRVAKPLRETIVFARQNLISDPSFSRVDIIACRNLLIYLGAGVQKKLFPIFHYALRPNGFLWLGASESIGGYAELFQALDKKQKIYSKKAASTPQMTLPPSKLGARNAPGQARTKAGVERSALAPARGVHAEQDAQREADRITVNQFAPPGVLIDAGLQVLQFRGATGAWLEPAAGVASFDILKMARDGLMLPLRAVINQAKKENRAARKENIRIAGDSGTRLVNVQAVPLKNLDEPCYLILFEDASAPGRSGPAAQPAARDGMRSGNGRARRSAAQPRTIELEAELAETRDYLQSLQEQHDAITEELQAGNEEIQSSNEELQSLNEELETSKEELESSNEELTTLNDEMAHRNAELGQLNSDLVNIQTSARQSIVLLGRDQTIHRFSAQAESQLKLLASDIGRPIGSVRHGLALPDLESLIAEVIDTVRPQEREVQDQDGRWHSLYLRPYLTLDKKVDGAVLVLMDIDALKRTEQAMRESEERYRALFNSIDEGFGVIQMLFDENGKADDYRFIEVNPSFARQSGLPGATGKRIRELVPQIEPRWIEAFASVAITGEPLRVQELVESLDQRWFDVYAFRLGEPQRRQVAIFFTDITERKRAEAALSEADHRKDEFLALLGHELRNPLAPIRNSIEILRRGGTADAMTQPASPSPGDSAGPRRPDSGTRELALQMIERQAAQLARLVDDLLDIGRISHAGIELRRRPVDVGEVVHQAAQAVRPATAVKKIELAVALPAEPVLLNADPARLAQVIGNLVNNACKFTDAGGRIEITVRREEASDHAIISVRDTGIGLAADQLSRIFEMFVQVDTSLGRTQGGLGIGLALAKQLVELHDGTMAVHSPGVGLGSEFVLRLPIMAETVEATIEAAIKPAGNGAVEAAVRPAGNGAMRILVVDDNRDAAESLVMLLELEGHEAHYVEDGLQAVDAADRLQPDAILLDIGLPGIDGYEAARKIRRQRTGERLVLVALTGWGQEADRRRSAEAGFDAHLTKPVDFDALMQLLANHLAG